jgi:hypothetical protein
MSQLGLGLNLSKTKGGVVPFNPLSLDPYLLFDTQSSMRGTLEATTLDLDPATPSSLDVITAVRAGVATYTDESGNIATAAADTVRVDQTQGAELTPTKFQNFGQTEFDQWLHARTSETVNATTSPDGENNGAYFEQDSGNTGAGSIYSFISSITGNYTASIYAKKKEKNFISFYDTSTVRTYFNLDTGAVGTVGSGHTATIEDAGDGWFRCSVTFTASSGTLFGFYLADTDNSLVVTDSGGIYIYGPQLEEGTTASSFVSNTTGSPKFITGATYGPRVPMILVEPSATNLLTYSEDFSNSYWGKNDVTVASAPVAAPDGTMTASHVVKTGANSHLVKVHIGAANTHIGSIWARTVSGSGTCFFDSASAATLSTVTDQWQRFEVTTNTPHMYAVDFRGASTLTEIYIWGAQLETGSVATSYIPTSGGNVAARTRAADDLTITGSAFSDFFNASEGTFYIEAVDRQATGSGHSYIIGQSSSQFFIYKNSGSTVVASYDGTNILDLGPVVANQLFRAAVTYKTGVSPAPSVKSLSFNGTSEVDQPYSGNFAATNILKIGNGYTDVFSGHFRRILFWPTHSDSL